MTIANYICKRDMYISEQDMNLSQMYCDAARIGTLIQSDYMAPADSAKGTSVTYTDWYRQDFRDFENQKRYVDFPLDINYRKDKKIETNGGNQLIVTSHSGSSRKFGGETNNKLATIMGPSRIEIKVINLLLCLRVKSISKRFKRICRQEPSLNIQYETSVAI